MAQATLSHVRIRGVASAVPERAIEPKAYYESFGETEVIKIVQSTGVQRRRVTLTLCTSDLAFAAATRLLGELQWDPSAVGALIFVSQTPDYLLPATSCVLHERLGLSKDCAVFDMNLGCSGYTYGLWTLANLMQSSRVTRGLLLVGDTSSRTVSPLDRATALLFGDAGTATALELGDPGDAMHVTWGTDGTGHRHIIQPAGLFRQPSTEATAVRSAREGSNVRSEEDTYMNGAEVFNFTLREVPRLVQQTLELAQWQAAEVDAFVFHQANLFMLNHLAKKMKLRPDQLALSLGDFGNTSSASIPLTLSTAVPRLREKALRLLMVGFGVGLSWSAIAVNCGPLCLPPLVEVPEP
jgi:3-oxoacyl-[acyl-carrier-protein] synthase-3